MEDAIEAENQLCTTLFSKKQQANLKKIKGENDDVKNLLPWLDWAYYETLDQLKI